MEVRWQANNTIKPLTSGEGKGDNHDMDTSTYISKIYTQTDTHTQTIRYKCIKEYNTSSSVSKKKPKKTSGYKFVKHCCSPTSYDQIVLKPRLVKQTKYYFYPAYLNLKFPY
jgi:hypothetical protein